MRIHMVLWLFCILFCSISFGINTIVVTGYCLGHQQSLLLHLKNNLTLFEPSESTKLVQWNQSVDCCEWKGVACNEGLVTGLDLSQESISGGIDNSSSLFSLKYLRSLNLSYNNIRSAIPSEFGKLTNLRHLNLSNAGFRGQVPTEISQLTSLLTLDLSAPELDLKLENPNLQMLIQNLTKITELYLDGVNIAAPGNEWGSALSSSMPNLQELSLSRCNLRGPIDFSLAKLQSLRIIRLSWNILSSPVPDFFANFENLTMLDLSGCRLQGRFPEKIFQVGRLEHLDLSYNIDLLGSLLDFPENGSLQTMTLKWTKFSGSIPNSISNLRHLSTLDFFHCQFNGTLPSSMSKLTKLSYLRLSSNTFTGPIPSFSMSENLTYLDLSDNDFNNSIPSTHFQGLLNLVNIRLQNNSFSGKIPSSMFELPSVQQIRLQNNQFDGQLDDYANGSSSIQEIDLSNNHLGGPIPKFLSQLTGLKILDLSYYNLSIIGDTSAYSSFPSFPTLGSLSLASCGLRTFPKFLENQSTLNYLDLSKNHFSVNIPQWIWNLDFLNMSQNYLRDWEEPLDNNNSRLSVLDLHSNQLQRILPVYPMNLEYIDFSNNNINSSIPESICNAQKLLVLNLANNSLTGKIPKCLIAMNGLIVLNVRGNKLTGSIDTFDGSCGLRTLDLNSNFLEGKLPTHLVNCTSLEVLDLGNNRIDAEFPCWLKNISTLRVLILRSNKLHGSFECPTTEAAWPSIQIVDLASNNLIGKIPPSFLETWNAMMLDQNNGTVLKPNDLHVEVNLYNRINYQDRVTLMNKGNQVELVKILTVFTLIDFSCNHFKGPIPEELGQLKALYSLNLSHNALQGNIPSSLGNLKYLESLDLANNSLSGRIPIQLASLTFLSVLNLSFNHLVGRIPTSTQIQSFEASSFKGNEGLCGPPLTPNCSGDGMQPAPGKSHYHKESLIDWNFVSAELGFTFGIGMVILPLLFWKRWRLWYCKQVEDMLYRIFPQLDFVYEYHGGKNYRTLRWKRN